MAFEEAFAVRQNERGQWEVEMPAGDRPLVYESRQHAELISEALRIAHEDEPSQSSVQRILEALQRRGMHVHSKDPLYRMVLAKQKKAGCW